MAFGETKEKEADMPRNKKTKVEVVEETKPVTEEENTTPEVIEEVTDTATVTEVTSEITSSPDEDTKVVEEVTEDNTDAVEAEANAEVTDDVTEDKIPEVASGFINVLRQHNKLFHGKKEIVKDEDVVKVDKVDTKDIDDGDDKESSPNISGVRSLFTTYNQMFHSNTSEKEQA